MKRGLLLALALLALTAVLPGQAKAQDYNLGRMYQAGQGVEADGGKAKALYTRACDLAGPDRCAPAAQY